jgi:hypothetical protein
MSLRPTVGQPRNLVLRRMRTERRVGWENVEAWLASTADRVEPELESLK